MCICCAKKNPDDVFAKFSIHTPKDHMISLAYTQYVHLHHFSKIEYFQFLNTKWTEVISPMQNALEIITKGKKKQFPIFQPQRLRSCQKWWAFLTLCALPVELQRGRRPISIKNHDMAQETPRFSEDGPWTRDQFARQGTLISFFPRLWTRDSCTFMIIYTSV